MCVFVGEEGGLVVVVVVVAAAEITFGDLGGDLLRDFLGLRWLPSLLSLPSSVKRTTVGVAGFFSFGFVLAFVGVKSQSSLSSSANSMFVGRVFLPVFFDRRDPLLVFLTFEKGVGAAVTALMDMLASLLFGEEGRMGSIFSPPVFLRLVWFLGYKKRLLGEFLFFCVPAFDNSIPLTYFMENVTSILRVVVVSYLSDKAIIVRRIAIVR